MKYTSTHKPLVCMQTQSTCYKGTRTMEVKGILWHSTGANNPELRRYVQPSDSRPSADTYSKSEWLSILGTNNNRNDWNHVYVEAGLNCWIGKLANGTVTTVQTMPWHYRPWGCGEGPRGSCNSGWIQFEICEANLNDKAYFNKAYKEACELTAYLCKLFNINPNGKVSYKGVQVPTILCHADSYRLGLGSGHGDIDHWFPKHGKSMATVRQDVAALLRGDSSDIPYDYDEDDYEYDDGGSPSTGYDTFSKSIENVLIRGLSVLDIAPTSANIELSVGENFNKYSWKYNLSDIKTNKAFDSKKVQVSTEKTKIVLENLSQNTSYTFELLAEDQFKNSVKSPKIVFTTARDYPSSIEKISYNYSTNKVTFTKPSSWGNISAKSKGYALSIVVNSKEVFRNNNFVSDTTSSSVTKSIANELSSVKLKEGDLLQIGIEPWVETSSGGRVYANTKPKYSKPVYIEPYYFTIDKIFVKADDKHEHTILYLTK